MNNQLTEKFMSETRKDISDIKVSVRGIEVNVDNIAKIMEDHNERMCRMDDKIDNKVSYKTFAFWRYVLVVGILISCTIGIFTLILDKVLS